MSEGQFNELSPAEAERLFVLCEELGEAQQAIGKILRHGYESHNPTVPEGEMEVWVTEFQCVENSQAKTPWAINEVFTSYRMAKATAADANDLTPEDAERDWKIYYRVRRYVPEPPPIVE